MSPRPGLFCCMSLACAILASGTGSHAADSPHPPIKRALLIGINRYQALPSLNGSLNDIETMRQVLTTRWGFHPNHITMLTDQAATRAGCQAWGIHREDMVSRRTAMAACRAMAVLPAMEGCKAHRMAIKASLAGTMIRTIRMPCRE